MNLPAHGTSSLDPRPYQCVQTTHKPISLKLNFLPELECYRNLTRGEYLPLERDAQSPTPWAPHLSEMLKQNLAPLDFSLRRDAIA
ncbi:hypothetical protein DEO72_LG5g1811 [Vigna unguiculata]|uniref:Uncharacterized protein n=1 Tax=Vigna unguiculata TaxID=3917 RepID=A0A4D6LYB2_VIGUN|nr:hypothetical protein DEO72_LG5g1811 [Vigna unguiculata]